MWFLQTGLNDVGAYEYILIEIEAEYLRIGMNIPQI